MKIYAISGLGADKRVFTHLKLDCEIIALDWIIPLEKEGIDSYSKRLAEVNSLDKSGDFILLGVSFGGLVATEISKLYSPKLTILISSIETKSELRPIFKLLGKTKLFSLFPRTIFNIPRPVAYFVFGTDKKELLKSILADTDLKLAKWSVNQLLSWKNETRLDKVLKISGSKDKLLPSKDKETVFVKNGQHFMIVDKAKEISDLINEKLKHL